MFQLDASDKRPLYEQIKAKLKELIFQGVLKENEKIPSVRELAGTLAINPNTIQKAYKELENEGYIYSKPAKGNFVSKREDAKNNSEGKEIAFGEFDAVLQNMRFLGVSCEELKQHIDKIYNERI